MSQNVVRYNGENFSGEKFSPDPFQKTFGTRVKGYADPGFYRFGSLAEWVCALDDRRSRPAVALRVRLRASPSAQDDTEADFTPILKQRRTYLLTYNAETNESLLQWEKVAAEG